MYSRLISLAACTLLMTPFAEASTFRIGIQPNISLPQGDLRGKDFTNGKMGYGGGAHLMMGFDNGHAILLRGDYLHFENKSEYTTVKMQTYKVGIDHNYFLSKKVNRGLYFTAGIGYINNRILEESTETLYEDNKKSFYFGGGLGYMFTPMIGLEVKYEEANFQHDQSTQSGNALNASLMFRF